MPSSQLLILGNGFDLHCGLKSSYKDFFQSSILDNIGVQYGLRQKKAEAIGFWENLLNSHEKNFELHKFSKTYRKMLNTNAETCILPKKNNRLIEIKFYGHSLSEADYSYFQSIFDYYNIYENNKVSLIFYYSKGFEQTDEVYRLINTYGKTLINKEQGKNLTHKLLLENRLKIVEIP